MGGGWIEGSMPGYDIGAFNHEWKYELKPYNPRNVTKGIDQRNKYKSLYNFYRPVQGGWNTIIEFY